MKPSEALATHRKQIREIVSAHHARNARVFGSVAAGTDTEASDLDILIDFEKKVDLLELVGLEQELSELLGIKVDLITLRSVSPSLRSYIESDLIRIV
jgi:predicted nucleotidyltransferase